VISPLLVSSAAQLPKLLYLHVALVTLPVAIAIFYFPERVCLLHSGYAAR